MTTELENLDIDEVLGIDLDAFDAPSELPEGEYIFEAQKIQHRKAQTGTTIFTLRLKAVEILDSSDEELEETNLVNRYPVDFQVFAKTQQDISNQFLGTLRTKFQMDFGKFREDNPGSSLKDFIAYVESEKPRVRGVFERVTSEGADGKTYTNNRWKLFRITN